MSTSARPPAALAEVRGLVPQMLEVVASHLPPALFDSDALPGLRAGSRLFVPLPKIGFECRLGAGESQIDLQQPTPARGAGPELLAGLAASLQARSTGEGRDTWARVHDLARAWRVPGSALADAVEDVWLEIDDVGRKGARALPSVVLGFRDAAPAASRWAATGELLALAGRRPSPRSMQALHACFAPHASAVSVCHLGLWLARGTDAVRVIVKGLRQERLAAYLDAVGWDGHFDEVDRLCALLTPRVDEIRFALDVGESVAPRLGLECLIGWQRDNLPRWADLLDELVARDLCTPAKRVALLGWHGDIAPSHARAPWPEQLILRSLSAPTQELGWLVRRLNHLKIDSRPGCPPSAKAYLGYCHMWETLGDTSR